MRTLNAFFTPLHALPVWGHRSVEVRFRDKAEEFRACAAECQEIADHWGGEGKHQYEELARQWLELATLAGRRRPPSG